MNKSTILLTGACGYLGSSLIKELIEKYPNKIIRILDNLQNQGYEALMNLPKAEIEFIEGDILDAQTVEYVLENVELVIHMAAIVTTPMNFEHPTWVHQINHWASTQLAEVCRANNIKFIYTSSTAVYGPGGPFVETNQCKPIGPYASSKRNAEKDIERAGERGLEYMILRLGSLFGKAPITRFDGVANRMTYLAGVGRALTVYGSGEQRRPVVHVTDASQAIIASIENFEIGKTYNVVSDNPSVLEIVNILQAIKPDLTVRFTEQDVLNHLTFSVNSSLFQLTGWTPKIDLHDGLGDLLASFQNVSSLKLS